MDGLTKEVLYEVWCATCKHWKEDEVSDTCNDCLNYPYNKYSHKPVNFEEEEK